MLKCVHGFGVRRGSWHWSALVLVIAAIPAVALQAEDSSESRPTGRFLEKVYQDAQGSHKYQVFLPAGYDKSKTYPTILYLHGSEECGRDGVKPVQVGLGPYVRARKSEFSFIVVFPQCETTRGVRFLKRWQSGSPDAIRALKILDQVERDYSVDRSREIVTGWSMGGYGAWSLAMADPKRWAAVVPVSGGGDATRVASLKETPVWVIHGPQDRIVFPERSREMVTALKEVGGRVRYDEPKSAGHGVWQRAYDSEVLESWLKNPRRPMPVAAEKLAARGTELPADLLPFVPAAHIGGAAYLRVGSKMLDAIAAAIPSAVPKDVLQGDLEPVVVQDDEVKETRRTKRKFFNEMLLEKISYRGQIEAVELLTRDDGTLRVKMTLKSITVDIGRAQVDEVTVTSRRENGVRRYVEKRRKTKAVASPSQILIAHNRPVVLTFVIEPSVVQRRLSLVLGAGSASFEIAEDQYEVKGPKTVEAEGLAPDKKSEAVYEALVSGLESKREFVAEKIREVVPAMLSELEQELVIGDASDVFGNLWPLPVFQPRVRLWPEALAIDSGGLSLAMGMTVAAVDPSVPVGEPRELTVVTDLIGRVPSTQTLRVGFAPGLLDPLTRIAINSGMARVDVRDTPEPLVRQLGDRDKLSKAIPAISALPSTTEVRTELVLTRPVTITPTGDSKSASKSPIAFDFRLPGAQLVVSTRTSRDWKSLAVFDLALEHTATLKLLGRVKGVGRSLVVSFPSQPKITMRGSLPEGVKTIDGGLRTDVFAAQFDRAWQAFANRALESKVTISDFEFGDAVFSLKDINWESPLMSIEFGLVQRAGRALLKPRGVELKAGRR